MDILPRTIIVFSQIFGAFPLKYISISNKKKSLTFSLTLLIGSSFIIAVQTVPSILWVYKVFSNVNDNYDSTILLTVILDFVTLTVLVIVVLVSNVRKYPRLVNFCCTLETIDQNLLQVPQNGRVGLKVTVVFILITTIITTETILQYKYSTLQQMNLQQDEYFTVYYFFFMSMNFVFGVLLVQFNHATQNIAYRFRKINGKIMHAVRDFGKYGMRQQLFVISPGSIATTPYETIKNLMNTYWLLCDATHQVNIFYSDQMIAAILALVVQLTINLFYFFHRVAQHDIIFIVNDLLWSLSYFIVLVLLSHSSTNVTRSCTNKIIGLKPGKRRWKLNLLVIWVPSRSTNNEEVKDTSTIVWEGIRRCRKPNPLKAEELAPMIYKMMTLDLDPRLKRQLELVLLQLSNSNVRFSAKGYFQINNEMITSIVGMVTTYLVVLIQFHTAAAPSTQH